jgi:hypothetical protein
VLGTVIARHGGGVSGDSFGRGFAAAGEDKSPWFASGAGLALPPLPRSTVAVERVFGGDADSGRCFCDDWMSGTAVSASANLSAGLLSGVSLDNSGTSRAWRGVKGAPTTAYFTSSGVVPFKTTSFKMLAWSELG